MSPVAVVGDALLDVSARPAEPMRAGADVPAEVRVHIGGQGANLAVRLARRGVDVALICGLADDAAGALVRDALDRDGVRLLPVPAAATGTVVVLVGAAGERTMLSDRSPFSRAAAAAVPPDVDWLVISGYLLLEPDAAAFARSLSAAPARRVLVGCAVSDAAAPAWRDAVGALRPDLVVLNRAEHALLSGAEGPLGLVVTDRAGATATIGSLTVEASGPPVEAAADTTGAGDAFAAGILAALLREAWPPSRDILETSLGEALTIARAVAGTPGAQSRVAAEAPGGRR